MPPARTSKNRGHALLALDAEKWHAPCLCWRHAAMQHGHRGRGPAERLSFAKVAGLTEAVIPASARQNIARAADASRVRREGAGEAREAARPHDAADGAQQAGYAVTTPDLKSAWRYRRINGPEIGWTSAL